MDCESIVHAVCNASMCCFPPCARYRWHLFGIQEDARVFAGYRYEQNESYLRTWLSRQKTTSQIFPPPDPDHCQGCNSEHTVDNPYPNAAYVDREGGFQLNPPLCSWCWLRKLVDSEGVRTAGDRGFVGYMNKWRFSANLDHLAMLPCRT